MIGIVVVTHGRVAEELVSAARTIHGELPGIAAVSIGWGDDAIGASGAIERGIAEAGGEATLVLTDMFGGTPANLGVTFLETDKVEVITGLNLAMLMKLARPLKDTDLLTLARDIREQGRNAIWVASDLIRGEKT
jgi:mannose PTS system EIIA component